MEAPFRFSSQPATGVIAAVKDKPPDLNFSVKRTRSASDRGDNLRTPANESFKSKLVGMAIPGSWSGMGSDRVKLQFGEEIFKSL